jgi:hypothetical protein
MKTMGSIAALALLAGVASQAAEPPAMINYQGVLRNNEDFPLTGEFPMLFRFWSAPEGSDEICFNEHLVWVEGGMFSVPLGSGEVHDGPGEGVYTSLADVFRDFDQVWIGVEVAGEPLWPRIRVLAAGYALNAAHLDGRHAESFVDVSALSQTKYGELTVDTSAINMSSAIRGLGAYSGGYFANPGQSGEAYLGIGEAGIEGRGTSMGGLFVDSDSSGECSVAVGDRGIEGYGNGAGGYFANKGGGGFAYIGQADTGVRAEGSSVGGHFKDMDGTGEAWIGEGNYGIHATGTSAGGWFQSGGTGTGVVRAGYGNYGLRATGSEAGGWFDKILVDGRTRTGTLEIVGGADLAEAFPLVDESVAPSEGSVVVIDDTAPGSLVTSDRPYDARVAGIVSGANGLQPGVTLGIDRTPAGSATIALSGRVFCLASTENGPIRPGDLLTTSATPGHAMRATDPIRSRGAVLGKAMSTLDEGTGTVLVLVALQ